MTENHKKIMQLWTGNVANVLDMHNRIWPGEHIDLLKPKFGKCDQDMEQEVWFLESTMPTSMLVSFIAFAVNNKHRKRELRAKAAQGLSTLLSILFAAFDGGYIEHVTHGTEIEQQVFVDSTGLVNGLSLWTREFFVSKVMRTWRSDYEDVSKPWVTHENGSGKIGLAEFLVFCLDPQHDPDLMDHLLEPALNILSYVALHLDGSVNLLNRSAETDMSKLIYKNRIRTARNVKTVWAEQIANKLWNGEAP